jgi:hypothetical protein
MEDLNKIYDALFNALFNACDVGDLETAKNLVKLFGRDAVRRAARYHCTKEGCYTTLSHVCCYSTLKMAQWFVEELGFTKEELRQNNDEILAYLCFGGPLTKLKWLVDLLQLTGDDVRAHGPHGVDSYLLRVACQGGYLDIIHWWAARFGYTPEELANIP